MRDRQKRDRQKCDKVTIQKNSARLKKRNSPTPHRSHNLRPCAHYARRIWKGGFSETFPETASTIIEPSSKRDNHRSFWICEISVRVIAWFWWHHHFRKASFSKCIPSTRKRKVGVFKFLRFEQPRSQGFSLEGGWGGKRPWHRLVTCPSYTLKSWV